MTSSNLNYILKALSPNTIALVVRASIYEYEVGVGRYNSATGRQSMSWIGVCRDFVDHIL